MEHFKKEEIIDVLTPIFNSSNPVRESSLVIQTANGKGPFGSRYRYGDFIHEIAFTRSSLNQVLKISGFNDTDYDSTGPEPHGTGPAARSWLRQTIQVILPSCMLDETGSAGGICTQKVIALAGK